MDAAREAVASLASLLRDHFGARLVGVYLYGSLPAGGFRPGRSDVDLLAVLESPVVEGEQLEALRALHSGFVSAHPEWVERIEIGYVSSAVLQSFDGTPRGSIAVISPGEPLNLKEAGYDWVLNWHDVCTAGEVVLGPPPQELGPEVSTDDFKRAIEAQLREWQSRAREPWVAYVPSHQGYIVVTLCRALCGLATGRQVSKSDAVAWVAKRFPEWAEFVQAAFANYTADVAEPHEATIRFVDFAVKHPAVSDAP